MYHVTILHSTTVLDYSYSIVPVFPHRKFLYDEVYDYELKNWSMVLVATTKTSSGILSTINNNSNSSSNNNNNNDNNNKDDQGKVVAAVALQKEAEEEESSELGNNWRVGFIVALDGYKGETF